MAWPSAQPLTLNGEGNAVVDKPRFDDGQHYQRILKILAETDRIM